jgi:hypothetical protein
MLSKVGCERERLTMSMRKRRGVRGVRGDDMEDDVGARVTRRWR